MLPKERCESGRIGLTANELTWETGSEGSNPSLSANQYRRPIVQFDAYLRASLPHAGPYAARLEASGFDGCFTAEGPHEPFHPLVLAARATSRITLFTNIAVAFARNPMDLAQQANDVQLLSRGRFILGLGSQIRPHIENRFSMPWSHPVQRMRELVLAVKAIHRAWNERTSLDFRGEYYRDTLMTPVFDPGPNPYGPPPVYVAALGPRMTEMAREVADGLLIHPFHSTLMLDRRDDSRATPFTTAATVIVCTYRNDVERERAEAGVRRLLGFYGSTPAYRVTLEAHGWGHLQPELNLLSKQSRWDELASLIPDEVFDAVVVSGPPEHIGPLLEARYAGLVQRVGFSMPYDHGEDCLPAILTSARAAVR